MSDRDLFDFVGLAGLLTAATSLIVPVAVYVGFFPALFGIGITMMLVWRWFR